MRPVHFGRRARNARRPSSLAADLAELERTNPAVALAADDLDRVTREITGRPPLARVGRDEASLRARNTADVTRELEAKRRRQAEAEAWIAEVRARKGKRDADT